MDRGGEVSGLGSGEGMARGVISIKVVVVVVHVNRRFGLEFGERKGRERRGLGAIWPGSLPHSYGSVQVVGTTAEEKEKSKESDKDSGGLVVDKQMLFD